jgi:hypothetical protein
MSRPAPPVTLSWQAVDRSSSFPLLGAHDGVNTIEIIETDHASRIA